MKKSFLYGWLFLLFVVLIGFLIQYGYPLYVISCIRGEVDEKCSFQSRSSFLSEFCIERLLSNEQAAAWALKVKRDRPQWKKKQMILHILGTASYITNNFQQYKKEYQKTNSYLKEHYGELLAVVKDFFAKKCAPRGEKVEYRFALPGFHIFSCNRLFSLPVASIHSDRQYEILDFEDETPVVEKERNIFEKSILEKGKQSVSEKEEMALTQNRVTLKKQFHENEVKKRKHDLDTENMLSFTLCLELPPSGGGLYVFGQEKVKVNYAPGVIVCHNGKTSHMIAPSPKTPEENSFRITLQGHGILDKESKTWFLYW